MTAPNDLEGRILAIEAEAAQPQPWDDDSEDDADIVAGPPAQPHPSGALREALERLVDMHEAGATTESVWEYAWWAARAALAAAPAEGE